uniref:Uncharacterized protein n=1 Tax=Romanomermis culicivorax TaxID=13658 RepID=A0A915HL98_ROMCU
MVYHIATINVELGFYLRCLSQHKSILVRGSEEKSKIGREEKATDYEVCFQNFDLFQILLMRLSILLRRRYLSLKPALVSCTIDHLFLLPVIGSEILGRTSRTAGRRRLSPAVAVIGHSITTFVTAIRRIRILMNHNLVHQILVVTGGVWIPNIQSCRDHIVADF